MYGVPKPVKADGSQRSFFRFIDTHKANEAVKYAHIYIDDAAIESCMSKMAAGCLHVPLHVNLSLASPTQLSKEMHGFNSI